MATQGPPWGKPRSNVPPHHGRWRCPPPRLGPSWPLLPRVSTSPQSETPLGETIRHNIPTESTTFLLRVYVLHWACGTPSLACPFSRVLTASLRGFAIPPPPAKILLKKWFSPQTWVSVHIYPARMQRRPAASTPGKPRQPAIPGVPGTLPGRGLRWGSLAAHCPPQ